LKVALTIGGSDPTGGAGIQMDLKVFQALGVYGICVITALTAQNSSSFEKIYSLSSEMIDKQFKTLLRDIKPYGAKTGMIYSEEAVECIIRNIKKYKIKNLVIDPVIISSTGKRLIRKNALIKIKEELIPLSKAISANIPEAEVLSGIKISSQENILEAAKIIKKIGTEFVIIKGGHLEHKASDFLYDGKNLYVAEGEKFSGDYHGTGCAFSSAFLAFLCLGYEPNEALYVSKNFVKNAIRNSLKLGKGMYLLKI
jgi:hydroxymethylpyrimidine/phosphomethylpyrimidine kinase